ncbi:hypothetical protein GCM10009793_25350 [Brachybacterium phenoliresistens]
MVGGIGRADPMGRDDESYRICAECGGDCEPEAVATESGVRISFRCPVHGIHTFLDPFNDLP